MDIIFRFDHSSLSITDLHRLGVRSPKWLEEVLADNDSQIFGITNSQDIHPVHVVVGFS